METLARRIYKLVSCRVKLTKKNGKILIGDILDTLDPEEEPELDWLKEEVLFIELENGEIYCVNFSEIADVERA